MDLEKQHTREEVTNPFQLCQNYVNDPESIYLIGKNWKDKFSSAIYTMYETVGKLERDEEIDKDFSYGQIEECINFLNSIAIERKVDERMKKFITTFIFLAHNINEHTVKESVITKKIQYLQRFCDDALTFSENLSLMKKVSERCTRWREWLPPSFRLSGHYYQLLDEE